MSQLPNGCDFLTGIAATLEIGYSTIRRLMKKPGFPKPVGQAKADNRQIFDYYNVEEVRQFRAKTLAAGRRLPADKTSLSTIDRHAFDTFHKNRRLKVTTLKSGKVVTRRVTQAPDRIGYYA